MVTVSAAVGWPLNVTVPPGTALKASPAIVAVCALVGFPVKVPVAVAASAALAVTVATEPEPYVNVTVSPSFGPVELNVPVAVAVAPDAAPATLVPIATKSLALLAVLVSKENFAG